MYDPSAPDSEASPSTGDATTPVQNVEQAVQDEVEGYRLLGVAGEGGMGVIYRAEERGAIRRTVALKIIRLGLDTKLVVARFEAERQALALMTHPNIARVFGAGITRRGRPYFAMEFVEGAPITNYCDRHTYSIRQRLELFKLVCEAVQHAHTKGIIHRDLKAGNVLVTEQDGKPVPKIIDFGVAKATNQRLTEKTLFTEVGRLVGTPAYMPPEQADGGPDVDTRSDVYSLGVLLYELLTGSLPFDPVRLRAAAYSELQRIIRDVEPPRPSTLYSQLTSLSRDAARRRSATVEELARTLQHELEWIPLKAMKKEQADRYQSAADFAQDIANYLSGQPLKAAPDSAIYRLRKLVRRNRGKFAAAAGIVVALLLGLAGTTWQMMEARSASIRAEDKAEEALRSEAAAEASRLRAERSLTQADASLALMRDLLFGIDPDFARGRDPGILLDALREGEKRLASVSDPLTRASYMHLLGEMYRRLNDRQRAIPLVEGSVAILRDLYASTGAADSLADHEQIVVNLAESLSVYAMSLMDMRRLPEAMEVMEEAHNAVDRHLVADHPWRIKVLAIRGRVLDEAAQHHAALVLLNEAVEAMDARPEAYGVKDRAATHQNRALALSRVGDRPGARDTYDLAARILMEGGQTESTTYANVRINQGIQAYWMQDYALASECFADGSTLKDRLSRNAPWPERVPEFAMRARLHDVLGQEQEAAELERRWLLVVQNSAPVNIPWLAEAFIARAWREVRHGNPDAAVNMAMEAIACCSQTNQSIPEHLRRRLAAEVALGEAKSLAGALTEAEPLLRKTAQSLRGLAERQSEPQNHSERVALAAINLAEAMASYSLAGALMGLAADGSSQTQLPEAETLLLTAEKTLRELYPQMLVETETPLRLIRQRLIDLYGQTGNEADLARWRETLEKSRPAARERVAA